MNDYSVFLGRKLLPLILIHSCISVLVIVQKFHLLSTRNIVFLNQTFISREFKLTFSGLEFHQWIEGWYKGKTIRLRVRIILWSHPTQLIALWSHERPSHISKMEIWLVCLMGLHVDSLTWKNEKKIYAY